MQQVNNFREKTTISIIDKLLNPKNDFNIRITLTGGEPLLGKDVFKIASALSDKNIPISLTANGFLVGKNNEEYYEQERGAKR